MTFFLCSYERLVLQQRFLSVCHSFWCPDLSATSLCHFFPIVWILQIIFFSAQVVLRVKPCPTSMSFIVSSPLWRPSNFSEFYCVIPCVQILLLHEFYCRVSFVQIFHLQRVLFFFFFFLVSRYCTSKVLLFRSLCPDTRFSIKLINLVTYFVRRVQIFHLQRVPMLLFFTSAPCLSSSLLSSSLLSSSFIIIYLLAPD